MGFFKFKKKMNFNKVDSKTILEESDFSVLTSKGEFIQFDYVESDYAVKPIELKPGIWSIIADMSGFHLEKSEYSNDKILDQFLHVKDLEDKVTCFFNKLDQYRKFGIEVPKRAALLYGPPGSGKTTSLNKVVKNYENDGKTAILIWSTDKVSASDVKTFFKRVEYRNVERLILIAEDIGGVEIDQVRLKSEPSLLSLLDNKERSFKIPTFIIATTNHPEVFLGNLVNRPDRFDDKIEMGFPSPEMRLQIYEFFSKEEASEEEKQLLKSKRCDEFTPAHLREILLRSAIYDKPRVQVINDILKEIEYYKSNFQKVSKVGFNDW